MISKIFYFITGFLICSALIFLSCNNNPVTPDNPFQNFRYPYQDGMYWFYNNRTFFYNIHPDSASIYIPNDTIKGTGISIFSNDTVINGVVSKLLRSEHVSPTHSHFTLESFIQTDTGLISNFGGETGRSFGPYSPNSKIKFIFNNREFYSIQDILIYYKSGFNTDLAIVDTTPVNCIKYPVVSGTEWHFNSLGNGLNVYKKYNGISDVSTPLGSFKCMQVQRIFKNSSTPDTNLVFYDYLSEKGMVKRDYFIKNIEIYNSSGQHIGYFDVKEEYLIELIGGL
jgi:hypothetical protein